MTCTSCNRESFHNEAMAQMVCAGCESAKRPWQAHHVVYEQHVKGYGGEVWDPRNARRLCIPAPDGCHLLHHGRQKLATKKLLDCNIEFAVDLMGADRAVLYLRRYYDDSDADPRLEALMRRDTIDLDAIKTLIHPDDPEIVMFGSAVLWLHGLRERVGDVEFFVTERMYHALAFIGGTERRPDPADPPYLEFDVGAGVPVNFFYDWCHADPHTSPEHCLRRAELVDGWRCMPLWMLRNVKVGAIEIMRGRLGALEGTRWEKHVADVEAIDAHLALVAA